MWTEVLAKITRNLTVSLHEFQLHVARQVVSLGLLAIPGLHALQYALVLQRGKHLRLRLVVLSGAVAMGLHPGLSTATHVSTLVVKSEVVARLGLESIFVALRKSVADVARVRRVQHGVALRARREAGGLSRDIVGTVVEVHLVVIIRITLHHL